MIDKAGNLRRLTRRNFPASDFGRVSLTGLPSLAFTEIARRLPSTLLVEISGGFAPMRLERLRQRDSPASRLSEKAMAVK